MENTRTDRLVAVNIRRHRRCSFIITGMQISIRVNPFNYLGKAFIDLSVIFQLLLLTQFLELGSLVISNVSILYCLANLHIFNLGLLIFTDVAFLLY